MSSNMGWVWLCLCVYMCFLLIPQTISSVVWSQLSSFIGIRLHLGGMPTGTDTPGQINNNQAAFQSTAPFHNFTTPGACCYSPLLSAEGSNEQIMTTEDARSDRDREYFSPVQTRLFISSLCPVHDSAQTQTHGWQRKLWALHAACGRLPC